MDYCGRAQNAAEKSSEASARERLELVLMQLAADKYSDKDYNKDEYVDKRLTENGMLVTDGDIVIVDGWKFKIDRETLEIIDSYGKGTESQEIQIESKVEYNETYTQATITYTISYDGDLKTIVVNGQNIGIPDKQDEKYIIQKNVTENGTYKIQVTDSKDSYKIGSIVVEELASNLEIRTAEELVAFRDKVNKGATFEGKTIKLTDDINLSQVCGEGIGDWTPIGDIASNNKLYFDGTFEGNNHTINNLYINNSKSNQGLFGKLESNGTIKNLTLKGTITAGYNTGGIVSYNKGNVQLCSNYTSLKGLALLSGIVSVNQGNMYGCINHGSVSGTDTDGGVSAQNIGVISSCVNTGRISISGGTAVGGIAGGNGIKPNVFGNYQGIGYIYNCYNIGVISGEAAGGISGRQGYNSSVATSYIYNSYSINTNSIIGVNSYGDAINCYTTDANTKLNELNSGIDADGTNSEQPWVEGSTNINNGYPILNWQ